VIKHHFVSIITCLSAFIAGYSYMGIGCMAVCSEVTSIFLSLRIIIDKKDLGKWWTIVWWLCSFITYTIFRAVNFPFCLYLLYKSVQLVWHSQTSAQKFFSAIVIFNSILITIMSYYWWWLLIKGLLVSIGLIKKPIED